MKKAALILIIIAGILFSCSEKRKMITFEDFDRLITTDSIESIQINGDVAVITKRYSKSEEDELELPIQSSLIMQNMLNDRYSDNKISNISYVNKMPGLLILNVFPLVLILVFILFFLFAAVDILKSQFASDIEKLIWILVVILAPIIGPILYLVIGRKQKIKK